MQLVFADSEVAGIEVQGSTLQVRFSAAAVTGGPDGDGYLPGLVLTLHGARWRGDAAACFGRLVAGTLSDAVSRLSRIELPFDGPGPWRADLTFSHGRQLVVQARHVTAIPGAAPFQPSYAC